MTVLITIFLIAVVVILIVTKKIKFGGKPKTKVKTKVGPEYNELTNYIEQALSYGATKDEIKRKLVDAGWPKDAIDKAFKAVKK